MINKKLLTIVLLTVTGTQATGNLLMVPLGAIIGISASGGVLVPTSNEQDREERIAALKEIAFKNTAKSTMNTTDKQTPKQPSSHKKAQRQSWNQSGRNGGRVRGGQDKTYEPRRTGKSSMRKAKKNK